MSKLIAAEYLDGLTFRSSEKQPTEDGMRAIPVERDLEPEDVLAWTDQGDQVVIVAGDGRKHVVRSIQPGTEFNSVPRDTKDTEKGKNKGALARDVPGGGKKK